MTVFFELLFMIWQSENHPDKGIDPNNTTIPVVITEYSIVAYDCCINWQYPKSPFFLILSAIIICIQDNLYFLLQ